jgi:hypothetical protein
MGGGGWIDDWVARFRGLGDSLLEVLRAELKTLQEDLTRSGRHLGVALALAGVALIVFFWWLGLFITLLVVVLAVWLQLWAATLIVLALFTAVAGLLGWRAWQRLRQVENPVETVRRHVDDHLDWVQNNLLREPATPLDVVPTTVSGAGRDGEDLP